MSGETTICDDWKAIYKADGEAVSVLNRLLVVTARSRAGAFCRSVYKEQPVELVRELSGPT